MSLTYENAMFKMPAFQRVLAEKAARSMGCQCAAGRALILLILKKRFGSVPKNSCRAQLLLPIDDQNKLNELLGISPWIAPA